LMLFSIRGLFGFHCRRDILSQVRFLVLSSPSWVANENQRIPLQSRDMTSSISMIANKPLEAYNHEFQTQAQLDLTNYSSFLFTFDQRQIDLEDYTAFLEAYSNRIVEQHWKELEDPPSTQDMSNSHFESKSYSSSTFSSSCNGEAPQTWRSTESASSNPQGTTIHRTSEQPGQAPTQERLQLDSQGQLMLDRPQESGRIEDVSEADREYVERMEDEYAKREGGA